MVEIVVGVFVYVFFFLFNLNCCCVPGESSSLCFFLQFIIVSRNLER